MICGPLAGCYTPLVERPSFEATPELTAPLYVRLVDPVKGPANIGEQRLEAEFAAMLLGADRARAHLERFHAALVAGHRCAVAMKGAAHTLDIYSGPLPRHLSDLDLVVHERDLDKVTHALRDLGYTPEPWNSPEDARLQAQEGPGLRCLCDGKLPVDLQTRLPGLPADSPALQEAWAAARAATGLWDGSDGSDKSDRSDRSDGSECGLFLLHPLHELLVAVAHFCVHLKPPLTLSPKWATDMLLMIHRNLTGRHPRIGPPVQGASFEEKLAKLTLEELIWPFAEPVNAERPSEWEPTWTWDQFWDTVQRWGIVPQCQVVGATLNAYWDAGVPNIPPGCKAIPLERLFETDSEHGLQSAASVPGAYMERIARLRALPTLGSRLRYLAGLVFPSEASLRHRYSVPDGTPIGPYRILHPVRTVWKLSRGLAAWAALRLRRPQ